MTVQALQDNLQQHFPDSPLILAGNELTLEVLPNQLLDVCHKLRDDALFKFAQLMDLCVVDYLTYGCDTWVTDQATTTGFSRGVEVHGESTWTKPRFAVVYHLLSVEHNFRLRLRTFAPEPYLIVPSVLPIWASAQWYEREAFDLFGVLFDGHPDLRRLLTDYGFIGHPFRKDFPLSGHVEVRYDPQTKRVIYQAVSIEPRVLVPKVIRDDSRYEP